MQKNWKKFPRLALDHLLDQKLIYEFLKNKCLDRDLPTFSLQHQYLQLTPRVILTRGYYQGKQPWIVNIISCQLIWRNSKNGTKLSWAKNMFVYDAKKRKPQNNSSCEKKLVVKNFRYQWKNEKNVFAHNINDTKKSFVCFYDISFATFK